MVTKNWLCLVFHRFHCSAAGFGSPLCQFLVALVRLLGAACRWVDVPSYPGGAIGQVLLSRIRPRRGEESRRGTLRACATKAKGSSLTNSRRNIGSPVLVMLNSEDRRPESRRFGRSPIRAPASRLRRGQPNITAQARRRYRAGPCPHGRGSVLLAPNPSVLVTARPGQRAASKIRQRTLDNHT